jgi:hypothetical protein
MEDGLAGSEFPPGSLAEHGEHSDRRDGRREEEQCRGTEVADQERGDGGRIPGRFRSWRAAQRSSAGPRWRGSPHFWMAVNKMMSPKLLSDPETTWFLTENGASGELWFGALACR